MQLIYLILTYVLILLNFAGLTAATEQLALSPACRRVFVIIVFGLTLFNLEHIHGFGQLHWLWPLTTLTSVWMLYRRHKRPGQLRFWRGELIFWVGVCYGLIWRFCFPNIDSGSEHLTDLYFISNYFDGETLPPNDRWLTGSQFNFYYAFQHYCAALLGRIFNLEIGLTMNVSWTILMGLITSLVWDACSQVIKQPWLKSLLLGCVLIGGNGLSAFMPWLIEHDSTEKTAVHDIAIERIWASTRFSGLYDRYVNTDFGHQLVESSNQPDPSKRLELPFETIAYLTHLGDYHPPLGGLLIALWTLVLFMRLEYRPITIKHPDQQPSKLSRTPEWPAYFSLGLTPALVLVTNTWVFPLQCILLASWMIYRQLFKQIAWFWLIAGMLAGVFSIYPFLNHFAAHSLDTPIARLSDEHRTPFLLFLTMHWPTLIWLAFGLLLWRTNRWCAWLSLTLALLLSMTELIIVDDPLAGKYQRFNTTLKWWSWLWPVTITGVLTLLLASYHRFLKLFLIITIIPLYIYSTDLIRYLIDAPKPQVGKITGHGWLRENQTNREILDYLVSAEPGVVLESIPKGAYTQSSAITLFANKSAVIGWPDHISQWHGHPNAIKHRADQVRHFYRATLSDPLQFLGEFPIRYIIWTKNDEKRNPGLRVTINQRIQSDYQWLSFYRHAGREAGLWVRTAPSYRVSDE